MLVKSLTGLAVTALNTKVSPTAAMSEWLTAQDPAAGFRVDCECELRAADESKAVVRYARHPLDTDEGKQYFESGKENGFDADAAIATGELRKLLPDLLEALGGEVAPA